MKLKKLIEALVDEELTKVSKNKLAEQFSSGLPGELMSAGPMLELTPADLKILVGLERALEIEINNSVDLEESSLYDGDVIAEAAGAAGFEYESTVIKAIADAGVSGNMTSAAGASKELPDADITLGGNVYLVEVKLDSKAQMGGSSVRYTKGATSISLVKELEPQTTTMLLEAVKSKKESLDNLLGFLASQKPKAINERAQKFSTSVTKDAWTLAAKKKLLVNVMLDSSTEFIVKHYAKKGIFYIQIGGAGLFYLQKNPAGLPVPKLNGNVRIEIRSARSGSRELKNGFQVVGGGIRVQGRLLTKNISPYSLDDPESIRRMLLAMADENDE